MRRCTQLWYVLLVVCLSRGAGLSNAGLRGSGQHLTAEIQNRSEPIQFHSAGGVEPDGTVPVTADPAMKNTSGSLYRAPRVYFLFLAVDKISNLDIWLQFFAKAPAEQYRAFVHCKLPSCASMLANTPFKVVDTVPSYYCSDLVSPMNQLLAVAHGDSVNGATSDADQFTYVSDSSLPAKPFSEVYKALSSRSSSAFCIFPPSEWADVAGGTDGLEMALKHHQWLTLSKPQAAEAVRLWSGGIMHNFMSMFRMNSQPFTWANNTFADGRNYGCLDEFWHMTALYGTLGPVNAFSDASLSLDLFVGSPLHVSRAAGWQGRCDTFVMWPQYLKSPGYNPFSDFHAMLDSPSVPHSGNTHRPGWWDTMSRQGMLALRHSNFLFARKFVDKPTLADGGDFASAYQMIVLAA
mmetsp:Transcript_54524/g.127433  ORF Transcript_54524/g.127433 Transcript_54524/m.127433 type:complete len:407 (-) Transcript_54524:70-1290(-)